MILTSPPFRFAHTAMGTSFEVIIGGTTESYARQTSLAVFGEIDRLESLLTRYNPCSEIGQINLLSPGHSLNIGADVFECLITAQRIHSETHGAFDINFAANLEPEGKSRSGAKEKRRIERPFPIKLINNGGKFVVEFPEEGNLREEPTLNLDLGGIGKGFALDKARDIIDDWGIEQALIHGGTSTALSVGEASGADKKGMGWPVGAGNTGTNRTGRILHLKDRALSGSGCAVKGRHIFDSRAGCPACENRSVWVSHPSAAFADALSTAFMVMEPDEVEAYCRRHPEVWALLALDFRTRKVFNDNELYWHVPTQA